MLWARLIRGTSSRLKAVTLWRASALTTSPFQAGWRKLIRTAPACIRPTSSRVGGWTFSRALPSVYAVAASGTSLAPAFSYASSGKNAGRPAPD